MYTIISVINYISSIATLILFIYLCVEVKKECNSYSKTIKEEDKTGEEQASDFAKTTNVLIKTPLFRKKCIVLGSLILVDIVTVFLM